MRSNGTTSVRTRGHRHTRRRRWLIASTAGLAAAIGLSLSGLAVDHASASPDAAHRNPPTAAGAEQTAQSAEDVTDRPGPAQDDFMSAFQYSLTHPTAVPAGANDWACRPSQAHPNPVVLVHGTFENRYANWAALAPRLKEAGYCVYALNYGGAQGVPLIGTGDMAASARQLASFVDRVRTASGAAQVDLVGHSQGGMMPRYYIDRLGGGDKVGKLVALTPPNHGTTFHGMGLMSRLIPGADKVLGVSCTSCEQQVVGSDFLKDLNAAGRAHPDVDYTVVATVHDQVVTPFASSYLPSSANVTNHTAQAYCPANSSDHINISYDPLAARLVFNALDPARAQRPTC